MRSSNPLTALLEHRLAHSRRAAEKADFRAQQRASMTIQRSKKLLEMKNGRENRRLLYSL